MTLFFFVHFLVEIINNSTCDIGIKSLLVNRTQDTERIPVYLTVKTCLDAEKYGTNESTRDIRDDCLFSTFCIPGVVKGVKWKVMKLIKKCSRVFGFLLFFFLFTLEFYVNQD